MREGLIVLDRDQNVTFLNSAAERLMGRRRADVVGKRLSDAFPGLRSSALVEQLDRAFKEKAVLAFDTQLPGRAETNHITLSLLSDPEGIAIVLGEVRA